MRISRFLIALLALSLQPVHADSLTLEEPTKNLDPLISSVFTCGEWAYQNQHGSYRVVSGWLWGHSEIYVQWLTDAEWDKRKVKSSQQVGIPQILATASFPKFDAYEADTDLSGIVCNKKNGIWVLEAEAEDEISKYHLSIELGDQPGKYTLEKSTTKK